MRNETFWVTLTEWRLFPGRTVEYQPGDRFEIDPSRTPGAGALALVTIDGAQVLEVVPADGFPDGIDVLGEATKRATVANLGPRVDPFWERNEAAMVAYRAARSCG